MTDTTGPARAALPDTDSLSVWQAHIAGWAIDTFGPTPAELLASRLLGEGLDVLDRAATGRTAEMGAALGGVLVVLLALAERAGVDLGAVLRDEQDRNEAARWRSNDFGQWRRAENAELVFDDSWLSVGSFTRDDIFCAAADPLAGFTLADARRMCGANTDTVEAYDPCPSCRAPGLNFTSRATAARLTDDPSKADRAHCSVCGFHGDAVAFVTAALCPGDSVQAFTRITRWLAERDGS